LVAREEEKTQGQEEAARVKKEGERTVDGWQTKDNSDEADVASGEDGYRTVWIEGSVSSQVGRERKTMYRESAPREKGPARFDLKC
jgi:hypothetical protein